MSITTSLREDHEIIEKVLKALDITLTFLREGKKIDVQILRDTLDFMTNFIDRCHHAKEENGLFPALNKAGLPRDRGPIAVMLMEHEEAKRLTKLLKEALEEYTFDSNKREGIIRIGEQYVTLLSNHIWKEGNILFNIADSMLKDYNEVKETMDRIEAEKIGSKEEYSKLADRLISLANKNKEVQ